jgi:hypothetical protein
MEITLKELSQHQERYKELSSSGTFNLLESYFLETFLQRNSGQSLTDLGEQFIYQSGILSVFRTVRLLAEGAIIDPADLALEEESLEDDSQSQLNN